MDENESVAHRVAARRRVHFVGFNELLWCDMEEVVDLDEFNASISGGEFEPNCFYTRFNDPLDPGYCLAAQSTNSSDPLTLKQASKRLD